MNVKNVVVNGKETSYYLFDNGDLYNYKNHQISTGSINNGYIRYNLVIDGEPVSFSKHRLLAELFIENDDPENKKVVHHKDGYPQNNDLSNLEWVSQAENMAKKINPPEHKITTELTEEEITAEVWAPFRDYNYEVSNMGRKRRKSDKKGVTFGSPNKNSGYIRWTFRTPNGKAIEVQAHRAVYEVFHPGEEFDTINHIDSNRGNNRLSNLENISQSENVIKTYYQTMTKKTVLVGRLGENGEIDAVYPSASEVARKLDVSPSSISRAVKKGRVCCGLRWREITKEEYDDFLIKQGNVNS